MVLTHVIDKIANFLWVGRARTVLRSRHQDGHHVIPEDLGPVVQTTVEDTEIVVLVGQTGHVKHTQTEAEWSREVRWLRGKGDSGPLPHSPPTNSTWSCFPAPLSNCGDL